MKKKYQNRLVLILVVWIFSPVTLMAGPGVNILGAGKDGPVSLRVSLVQMQESATTFEATDPNFFKDGPTKFTGILIRDLLSLLEIHQETGVTFIASDQYVGHFSSNDLKNGRAMLAWALDGKRISPMKGGPFKIVFPDDARMHGSCYVWYVDMIVAGNPFRPGLEIVNNRAVRHLTNREMAPGLETLDEKLFSIPSGCRGGLDPKFSGKSVHAVTLNKLIDIAGIEDVGQVTLVPFVGSRIRIHEAALSYPIYIVVDMDEKPVHPAFGGPYFVIFPVELYAALAPLAPESGALFFLNQIIVE